MSKITPNSRTSARRRHERGPARVVVTGAAVVAALILIAALGARSPNGLPLRDYRTLYVSAAEIGNLQKHNEVRARGVRIGQVIDSSHDDGRLRVELKLDPGTAAFPADTRALIRGQGLLGQRYLELVPGRSDTTLPWGTTITADPSALIAGLPELLDTFDPRTRAGLQRSLRGLGQGFAGRGHGLNDALVAAPPTGRAFLRTLETLLQREDALERLMPSVLSGVRALDLAGSELAAMFAPAADALQPFAEGRSDLQRTLSEAPGTLRAARGGVDEGRRLLAAARFVATSASDVLPAAPEGLRTSSALLRESHVPLDRATALLRQAEPAVPAGLELTRALSPVLEPLERLLEDATPLVNVVGERACDLDNFAENWRSTLGYGIPTAGGGRELPSGRVGPVHSFRVTIVGGPEAAPEAVGRTSPIVKPEIYTNPCRHSPGTDYPLFVPTGGGRGR